MCSDRALSEEVLSATCVAEQWSYDRSSANVLISQLDMSEKPTLMGWFFVLGKNMKRW